MNSNLDPETRINLALGKVLRYFNLFELNLGLCIRILKNPEDAEQSHSKLDRTSVMEKVQLLKDLLTTKDLIRDQEEFDMWHQEVEDARCKIDAWSLDYNEKRPHSSIGHLTPVEFAKSSAQLCLSTLKKAGFSHSSWP